MRARRWCRGLMERRSVWVLALGILGMVGFIGSFAFVSVRWVGEAGFLATSALALASYSVSLFIAHLADSFELRRRYATEVRREPAIAVVPLVTEPRREVEPPLAWRPELTSMRSVRSTVGHA